VRLRIYLDNAFFCGFGHGSRNADAKTYFLHFSLESCGK
jgi:hypothetical protein